MIFKKLSTAIVILIIGFKGFSQNLVSPKALSKMMVDYYNYTLVGSQTPTTGFKFETNKPSITLKGNIFSSNYRRFIINTELEGGLDNSLMQVVSGKDVNTYFKANIGLNFLLANNIASHYTLTPTETQITENAFMNNKMLLARQLDTFLVIKIITDDDLFQTYNFQALRNAVITESNLTEYQISNLTRSFSPNQNAHYDALIRNILLGYGTATDVNDDNLLANFRTAVANVNDTTIRSKKLLEDYDRIKEKLLIEQYTLNDTQYDFEIALTKTLWTWKKIHWINVSLSASNNNFKIYYPSLDSLEDSNSFLPAITVSYNLLFKSKEAGRFSYVKGGVIVQRTNSLIDLQKFDYKKETVISVSPTEELKSSKEGVAYQGDFKEDMGFDIFVEGYTVPWKQPFVPGFYLKTAYRHSKAWINENKLSLDLGLIWNVTNNDKDAKNLLSIIPYVSWTNLMKEYKDITKTEEKKLSDLFMFNVKFGIPINLGK